MNTIEKEFLVLNLDTINTPTGIMYPPEDIAKLIAEYTNNYIKRGTNGVEYNTDTNISISNNLDQVCGIITKLYIKENALYAVLKLLNTPIGNTINFDNDYKLVPTFITQKNELNASKPYLTALLKFTLLPA